LKLKNLQSIDDPNVNDEFSLNNS
jgi:hypothetical protein